MFIIRKYLVALLLLLSSIPVFCQEKTQALNFSVGFGAVIDVNSGLGIELGLGYEKNVFAKGLRINTRLTFGLYAIFETDEIDNLRNSYNFRIDFNYDLLTINSFSLVIGTGLTGNLTTGLGRDSHTTYNTAFNGLWGLRFLPKNSKFIFELIVIDFSVAYNLDDLVEIRPFQFRLAYKI